MASLVNIDEALVFGPNRDTNPGAEKLPFLIDAHCHLGFTSNAKETVRIARGLQLGAWCCTVTPDEYLKLLPVLDGEENLELGLGVHPWWLQNGESIDSGFVENFMRVLPAVRLVGEVGLDFSSRYVQSRRFQLDVFEEIMAACAHAGEKTISIHCVQAYEEALSIIEAHGVCHNSTVVFHWFSGNSDELNRAIRLGCYFSVGKRMLSTKKGRAYVRQMPSSRILLETDLPNVDARSSSFYPASIDVQDWRDELDETFKLIRALRNNTL